MSGWLLQPGHRSCCPSPSYGASSGRSPRPGSRPPDSATTANGLSREHEAITDHQERVERGTRDAERRLVAAQRTLEEHDRPLHRRGHRAEISAARRDIIDLPEQIDQLAELAAELEDELTSNESEFGLIRNEQAQAEVTRDQLERRLDDDATTRGVAAVLDPTPTLVAKLGPCPEDSDHRARWIKAAGRAGQHRTLWPIPEGQILGSRPRSFGQDDYATTHYRTEQSLESLHRSRGFEPVGRDLGGLSL